MVHLLAALRDRARYSPVGQQLKRRLNGALRILMYHRFPAGEIGNLDRQCQHLRRHYRPVSMREVAENMTGGKPLPPRAVAVTVDDGYRDFADNAAAVFQTHGIPATLYPLTSFLDRERTPWWDVVTYVIERTSCSHLDFDGKCIPLATPEQRSAAMEMLHCHAKSIPNRQCVALIQELGGRLGVKVPKDLPSDGAPLSWEQVRQLQAKGFEFGAHTHTHPILSRVETLEELHSEINLCKKRIEEETGSPVIHFCYPNGRPEDIDSRVLREVSAAGYATAVTAIGELNDRSESRFLLRRYAIYHKMPLAHFVQLVAGMHEEPHADLRGLLSQ
jgi:peptidoglycan/xylan/chitin deacetylase (PgdA/CDA1 family)